MDRIYIKRLEFFAKHGVFQEENVLGQKFLISAVLHTDIREAGKTDDLTKSIHYGDVSHMMKEYLESHTFALLERAVETLAEKMLLEIPGLQEVELEMEKPWAPIGLHLETVSVAVRRKWHRAYIALGSNMGQREGYMQMAVDEIGAIRGCEVEKVSSFVRTAPYGGVEQEDFLNGCMQIRTLFTPRELLEALQAIEQKAGRERKIHWGPRTLDLDIIFYDREVIEEEDLQIPQVEMAKRDFVLLPLREIAPWLRHPITGKSVGEMAEELTQHYVM